MVGDSGANDSAGPGDHLDNVCREPCLEQQFQGKEGAKRGGGVRFCDDCVSCCDSSECVGNPEGEGVVPRADLAHYSLGVMVFAGSGNYGECPGMARGPEE